MKKWFLLLAIACAAASCDKDPQQTESLDSEDNVYMEFTIQTLTTRSSTDGPDAGSTNSNANPDYEVGKDVENTISTVDVVLRNANTYISATVTAPASGTNSDSDSATSPKKWIATFTNKQLTPGVDYQVYIYANCSAKQDLNAISEANISEMTADNKFWMTNAYEAATVNFTSYSTDKNNPTDLGTHYVERAMARFDIMPKGPYTLADDNDETAGIDETITVSLTEAALINQSKAFYLLRRVSSNGTNTGWTIGGVETPNNYVVDTDYAAKANGYTTAAANNFDAHSTDPTSWEWKSIVKDNSWVADNWNGTSSGSEHSLNDYYIWQYCKENTIPGTEIQEHGITTGIAFKGKLEGALITAAAGKPIYVFNGILYGTWDKVIAAAAENNAPEALKFAVSVCNNADNTAKEDATLKTAGFTIYKAAADSNYYTYYYYWNRHNDNGDNTKMGKMEFAVVRNNIYKLCVDSIEKYGHPTPGEDIPDIPDEQDDYYFKVSVKVLPWVVRVNHIEF